MDNSSGIGVLDKVVLILDLLSAGSVRPAEVIERTELPKPTVHRLLQGLAHHGLAERDEEGRYSLGVRMAEWGFAARSLAAMKSRAQPILDSLCAATGLSAQIYVRSGSGRLCVASSEPPIGLRDSVPVGSHLTLHAGSAAQVLLAWESSEHIASVLAESIFDAETLSTVRRKGHAVSIGEREPGVASVSAPVWELGRVVAAVSISGAIDLMGRRPGSQYAAAVTSAGESLSDQRVNSSAS